MKPEVLLKLFKHVSSRSIWLDTHQTSQALSELSCASGISYHRLRAMTLARWVSPIEMNRGVYQFFHNEYYKAYITGFRCIPKQTALKGFYFPSMPWADCDTQDAYRGCTACLLGDEIPYERITWRFGFVQSCPIHGLNLVPHSLKGMNAATKKPGARILQQPITYPSLLNLDAMTTHAMRYGFIELPNGRRVSATWWLRLIMGLADELLRVEEHYLHGFICSPTYKQIWDRLGYVVPTRSSRRPIQWEPGWRRYHPQLFAAVGMLIEMLAEGEVRVIAGRRVRRIFKK